MHMIQMIMKFLGQIWPTVGLLGYALITSLFILLKGTEIIQKLRGKSSQ
jgi:hypothetical protein